MSGMFGFTNDSREFERVMAWRDAAIADGWNHDPQYESESEERACKMSREGFRAMIITRSRGNYVPDPRWPNHQNPHRKWTYEAEVNLWGPDGVVVNPGHTYDWKTIWDGLRVCPECGAKDVETLRVAFANRACEKCRPALEAQLCKPGWCD